MSRANSPPALPHSSWQESSPHPRSAAFGCLLCSSLETWRATKFSAAFNAHTAVQFIARLSDVPVTPIAQPSTIPQHVG
jgi:hypothetical protein